jgi:hypothetical protein
MEREPVQTDQSSSQVTPLGFSDSRVAAVEAAPYFQTIGYEEFTPNVASLAEVRRFVRRVLEEQGLKEEPVAECELIADELATNAITYAGSFYSVVVEQSAASVRIGVRDDSRILPASGRGLRIVSETSSHWGTESLGLGKETWADVVTEPGG